MLLIHWCHSLLVLLFIIIEKLSESFTSPYDLMFTFFLFVSNKLLSLLIFNRSFRYFERVMDFFAAVIRQHGVVKGTLIILAGMCFFSLSFYYALSQQILLETITLVLTALMKPLALVESLTASLILTRTCLTELKTPKMKLVQSKPMS